MGLPSNVARLVLYTWLLLMWNGIVWTLVFPVTATLGVVCVLTFLFFTREG